MKDFTMTIKGEDILNEIISLVNEGDEKNSLPKFIDVDYEDLQDYLVDLKDVLVKKYLYDYYEDDIYIFLKRQGF